MIFLKNPEESEQEDSGTRERETLLVIDRPLFWDLEVVCSSFGGKQR